MNYPHGVETAANSAERKTTDSAWEHGFNWGAIIGVVCGAAGTSLVWWIVRRFGGLTP